MGYKIIALQNSSNYPNNPVPTIKLTEDDKNWNTYLKNYLMGSSPSDSLEWKKGAFAITKLVDSPIS